MIGDAHPTVLVRPIVRGYGLWTALIQRCVLRQYWFSWVLLTIWLVVPRVESIGSDFSSVYFAGRVPLARMYTADPVHFDRFSDDAWSRAADAAGYRGRLHRYLYLPLWAGLAQRLPDRFDLANQIVLRTSLVAFAVALWLSVWHWFPALLRPMPFAVTLVAISVSIPWQYAVALNQPQLLVVALMLTALVAAERNHSVLGGALLAVAIAIKITPAIFVGYWLVSGRRRAVIACAAGVIALTVLSIGAMGWTAHAMFAQALNENSAIGLAAVNNQSLVAAFLRTQLVPAAALDWRIWPIAMWMRVVSALVTLAGFAWIVYEVGRHRLQVAVGVSWLVLLWCVPISWSHYYIGLLFPALVAWTAGTWRARIVVLAVALLNSAPFHTVFIQSGWYSSHLVSSFLLLPWLVDRRDLQPAD